MQFTEKRDPIIAYAGYPDVLFLKDHGGCSAYTSEIKNYFSMNSYLFHLLPSRIQKDTSESSPKIVAVKCKLHLIISFKPMLSI
jgi:hypothetical protein